ncbi:MAG: RloB domain-containing protein, partial [Candidatus Aminicenantes bacterium]
MGTDNLFWKRKNKSLKRKSRNRGKLPESFLIVCEGGKTEPNYFKAFKLSSAAIRVEGLGMNTLSLVQVTLKIIERAKKDGILYDQVWCVFDRNHFPIQNFNNAIDLANKKNIKVAYSNEAFELWYLLHFHYYNSGVSRNQYFAMLSKLLNAPYKKNDTTMY